MEELLDQQHKLLMRGSLLHARIGARKVPKVREPPRASTAWDHVLEEMKWMAQDFTEERRHKSVLALVLVTEIRENQKFKLVEQLESIKQAQTQAKDISDAVQQCYLSLDDGIRGEDDGDVLMSEDKDAGPKVANYMIRVIRRISYSEPIKETEEAAPASADENPLDQGSTCDDTPQVSVHNMLFYDVEEVNKGEADFKALCETLSLEDVDVFAPPADEKDWPDMDMELWSKERSAYNLLPDAEELMLLKQSQPQEETLDLPRLMRFQSEIHDFSNSPRLTRRWQIFQDMYLERYICEHGGHWDLVADLLNGNPYTRGGCFGMRDCRERWIALQRQKGRSVDANYVPQAVLQGKLSLVTDVVGRYSLFPLILGLEKQGKVQLKEGIAPKAAEKPFEFLVGNCSLETNSYFYNYAEINAKYYPEEAISKYSFLAQASNVSLRSLFNKVETTPIARPAVLKDPGDIIKPTQAPQRPTVPAPVLPIKNPPRIPPQGRSGPTTHLNVHSYSMTPSSSNLANTPVQRGVKRRGEEDGNK